MGIIASILLLIDGVIYNTIKHLYNIFDFMAGINIFNDDAYQDISNKIYVILGLIMMFVLAYSLLRAVMNLDDFAKGEKSFPNLIKNIIISLALIVVMPAIFSFAMDFQAAILDNNTIYKFILDREDLEESNVDIGSQIAYYTFTSFFYPSEEFCTDGSGGMTSEQAENCKSKIKSNGSTWYRPSTWFNSDQITLADYDKLIESGQASFTNYNDFSNAVADNEISYSMIISTIAGVFVLYVLANFCFDVAVRVIKLAFYQLIAPIPIICRILPGGNMKDVFDKWTKQTISVYIEVFIRIAVMALGVYLMGIVIDAFNAGIPGINTLGFVAQMVVRVLLIMAVIIFIRQAPKLIGDLFHLDTGGMKLGIMDKLAMGGALFGAAAFSGVGGGASSAVKRYNALRNKGTGRARAFLGAAGALGAGTTRAVYGARKAKNLGDINKARSTAISNTLTAGSERDQRKVERKQYVSEYEQKHNVKVPKYLANAAGAGLAAYAGVKTWATGGIDQFSKAMENAANLKRGNDAILNEAEKLVDKNNNDNGIILDSNINLDGTFKKNQKLFSLYNQRKGQSLSSWQKEIQGRSSFTDFASLVDRNSFNKLDIKTGKTTFDNVGYQNAIQDVQRKYYQESADLENAYNLLRKQVIKDVADAGMAGQSIGGIGADKMSEIQARHEEFKEELVKQNLSVSQASGKTLEESYDDFVTAQVNEANKLAGAAARSKNRSGSNSGGGK